MKKEIPNNDLIEYLIPKKFPAQVVTLVDQAVYTAVQQTNATPKATLPQYTVVTVEGLRWTENGVPFFKLQDGYIKADVHQLVLLKKGISKYVYEDVEQVTVVSPRGYYSELNFNDRTRLEKSTRRGEIIPVEAVEWTLEGIPRLRTADGYIAADKDGVSTSRKSIAYLQKFIGKSWKTVKSLFKKLKKTLRRAYVFAQMTYFRLVYIIVCRTAKINENKVLFLSDSRNDLSGNFQYIVDEINRQDLDFDLEFLLKKTNNELKSWHEYTTLAYKIATSHHVILDDFYPVIYPLKMRDGVDLIQVWHAVGAFKTFGFSRVGKPGGPNPESKNHRNYDYAIVSSTNVAPFYAEGFGIDREKVLPIGAPRTDLFFDETKKAANFEKLSEELPFINDKKVILFAPTFRGTGQRSAHYPYEWLDFKALYEALSPQGFVFLLKVHPFVKNELNIPVEYADFFYDVSSYREVNDLLLVSDVLITDYSSVVFEYSLLKRKTIFFTPDLEEYTAERDFYVNFKEFTPGPIVTEFAPLIHEIETYDDVDEAQLNDFLDYNFDDIDGQASKRFVDAMVNGFENVRPYKQQ